MTNRMTRECLLVHDRETIGYAVATLGHGDEQSRSA